MLSVAYQLDRSNLPAWIRLKHHHYLFLVRLLQESERLPREDKELGHGVCFDNVLTLHNDAFISAGVK